MSAQTGPAITTTLNPALTGTTTNITQGQIGWALNGVKFDPSTAETCPGKPYCPSGFTSTFNVEALGQTLFSAGVDGNNAHVQPNGAYHYHGMPDLYLTYLNKGQKLTLIGFASDGFPIYAKWGYNSAMDSTSGVRLMVPSYRIKATLDAGRVSSSVVAAGTFTQDWEYVAGLGDLDECNGRFGVTPEFPNGIYHYYLTTGYPYIQRCMKGTRSSNP